MTTLASFIATDADTSAAMRLIEAQASAAEAPDALVVYCGQLHDEALILARLRERFADVPVVGATSSGGVVALGHVPDRADIGVLAISDPAANFGVGARTVAGEPVNAARGALEDALAACDCEGELPSAIIVHQPPGMEEGIIEGLRAVVGDRCPIIGGSAADDEVNGRWRVISSAGFGPDVVAVMVILTAASVATAFQSGYAPTGKSGRVTAADGRRLQRIEDRPAAAIYNEWRGGNIRAAAEGGSILAASALSPLGVSVRRVGSVPQHRLLHPAFVHPDGSMDLFARIVAGDVIELMEGSPQSLARRAARVLSDARAALPVPVQFAGALLVYCGGCAMSLGDQMRTLVDELDPACHGRPIMGVLTFGEQGMLAGSCAHGNLMVSALAFSR